MSITAVVGAMVLITAAALVIRQVIASLTRHRFQGHGDLLVQMELGGQPVAYVATLRAADRNARPDYLWNFAGLEYALPYTQMRDLPFTHIRVRQKPAEPDILSVSVIDTAPGFGKRRFFWIKDAALGRKSGFAQTLLLPNNLVLYYLDEGEPAGYSLSG